MQDLAGLGAGQYRRGEVVQGYGAVRFQNGAGDDDIFQHFEMEQKAQAKAIVPHRDMRLAAVPAGTIGEMLEGGV